MAILSPQARFYGGSEEITLDTAIGNRINLGPGSPRVIVIDNVTSGGASGWLRLPDANKLQLGGPLFYVINNYWAKTVQVIDYDLDNVGSAIPYQEGSLFLLVNNDDAAGSWLKADFANIPIL